MKKDPVALERPVVVVGPFIDPGVSTAWLRNRLQKTLGPDAHIIAQGFTTFDDWDRCALKTVAAIDEAFPTDDPRFTTEVDVVGFSMGGLVARHAAAPRDDDQRRLKIARLFTISTPHRGAKLADLPAFNAQMRGMRAESEFFELLHAREALTQDDNYPVFPYTRYWDETVDAVHAAPAEADPLWVPNPPLFAIHPLSFNDPRFLADICRRLRGEAPLGAPAPLPKEDESDQEEAADSAETAG